MKNHSRFISDICSSYDWVESYSIDDTLRTVLSHNDEATSIQIASVASSKERIDFTLESITHDIDSLQNALDLLRSRQDTLDRLSVKHAGALSKLRQLPNEILQEIFLHACCDERVRVGLRRRNEGPWQLRKVCQKWARIVEGCAQLWSRMFIFIADDVNPALFAQALQFCGSRHIDLKLELAESSGRQIIKSLTTVLDMITSSSSRWESLNIKSDNHLFRLVWALFPRLERKVPALCSLKLQGGQLGGQDLSYPTRLSALLTAPLLENVHLDLYTPEIVPELLNILPIPCHQIRRLLCNSHKYELAAWHVPLSLSKENFPLLERCMITSFDRYVPISNHIPASDRIEHNGVVHFTTSQTDVLDVFSFPSLRTLSLGKSSRNLWEDIPFFPENTSKKVFKRTSEMLLASRCSLVSLVLLYSFTLVDEFLHVLDVVPTLEFLDMNVGWSPKGSARDDVLCKLFTALGSRTNTATFSLLPALQDLRLSIVAPYCRFIQRYNLRFISQALDAMTERSKCPSNLCIFSFALFSARPSPWRLLHSDIDQLRAHKMIRFSTNTELHPVESFESVDDKDDESSLPASSPPLPLPESDDETFDDPLYLYLARETGL